MRSILIVALLAACGAKSAPPSAPPPSNTPPPAGSDTPPPTDEAGPICGTRGAAACPANMFCNFEPGAACGDADRSGHCMVAPEICPEIFQPVCGCDGKTHPNSCQAAAAKTGVRSAGECKIAP